MSNILSIIINDNKIRIAQLSGSRRGITVGTVLEKDVPVGMVDDGVIQKPGDFAKFLRNLLKANGISTRNVFFTLPSDKVMTREIVLPEMKDDKLKLAIQANASEYFPINLDSYDIGYFKIARMNSQDESDATSGESGAAGGMGDSGSQGLYGGPAGGSSYGQSSGAYANGAPTFGQTPGYSPSGISQPSYENSQSSEYAGIPGLNQTSYGSAQSSYGQTGDTAQSSYTGSQAPVFESSAGFSLGDTSSSNSVETATESIGTASFIQRSGDFDLEGDQGEYADAQGFEDADTAASHADPDGLPPEAYQQEETSPRGLKALLAKFSRKSQDLDSKTEKEARKLAARQEKEEQRRLKREEKETGKSGKEGKLAAQLRLMVVAAPDSIVQSYYDVAQIAKLHVKSVDFIGNSVFQITAGQIGHEPNAVIQMDMDHTVVSIFDRDVMLLQRHVDFTGDSLVQTVMQEKGIDAERALYSLKLDTLLHPTFSDNDPITETLYYLVGNVRRTMEYYAGRNAARPLQRIYIMGDAIYFKGIQELIENELSLPVERIMTLKNVTVSAKSGTQTEEAMKYLDNIGAIIAPIGFVPHAVEEWEERERTHSNYRIIVMLAVLAALVIVTIPLLKYFTASTKVMSLQRQLVETEYVEPILADYETARIRHNDVSMVNGTTASDTQVLGDFLYMFEQIRPSSVSLNHFNCNEGEVSMEVVSEDKEAIATLIQQVQSLEYVENVMSDGIRSSFTDGVERDTTNITLHIVNETKRRYQQEMGMDDGLGQNTSQTADGTAASGEDEISGSFYNTTVNASDVPDALKAGGDQ